ncbi:MAG: wax ester/triacylglycerol synthase family O-acyltransferase [Phyllobacteriaceae bacterium]|nr:wax ester/triacylglycerol synthase family O-acyltransferase [Phyllobacteriaceae bacterium]
MAHSEQMAPVDATWLRMDRPTNLMVIVGVLKLAGPVKVKMLEKLLAERLLGYRRFRQRAETRPAGIWWVDDRHFDVSRHIHHIRLPGAGGDAELEQLVGDLASTPLDHSIPLWQFHIVEKFEGGAAVVARIHHAIADGIALMGVMLSLTDEMHAMAKMEGGRRTQKADDEEDHDGALSGLFAPVAQAFKMGSKVASPLLKNVGDITANPAKALDLIKTGSGVVNELAWLLTMPDDSATSLKGKPLGAKRVAWTDPLPLGEIKAVGKALGCSVNDILLSAVAGAIGSYLVDQGEPTEGVEIRAVIPVNLRQQMATPELGNSFGLVALELPVGIEHPVERLFEVRKRMDVLKNSVQAPVVFGLLSVLGYAPKMAQDLLFDFLLDRTTAVMTNVPGPQFQLAIAGSPVTQIMFWVPQASNVGMGVSILSYNGKVQFGLMTDAALTPEPRRIIDNFGPQFEQLLYFTLMDESFGEAEEPAVPPAPAIARKPRALKAKASGRRSSVG